jgi:cell pole-organizing protein PopZ
VAALRPTATEPEPPNKSTVAPTSRQADPSGSSAQLSDLMAPETAAAATSLVGGLVRSLTAGRNLQVYSRGPTLEDLVRAELRPLLKEWLDANLPPIVERLVRTEIERVVGRAVP